jgi:hypothetical protein
MNVAIRPAPLFDAKDCAGHGATQTMLDGAWAESGAEKTDVDAGKPHAVSADSRDRRGATPKAVPDSAGTRDHPNQNSNHAGWAWAEGGAEKTDVDAGKLAVSAALQIAAA